MGASIVWRKISKKEPRLGTSTPSSFMSECEKVFGRLPFTFTKDKLEKISVLMRVSESDQETWAELYDLIDKYEEIEVDAKY